MSYNYYNLSSDDSGRGDLDSEESEQEEMNNDSRLVFQDKTKSQAGLWDRIICHLDVDCFYCQCEEIDGPPHYKERPLAIGQKHIIVTSNYVARKYGVKKLQSRDAAYAACPNLLILEGSDLEHYRKYSRKIYLAFREKVSQIAQQVGATVHVRKGGLDENFCDLTDLVNKSLKQEKPKNLFVYGESPTVTSAIVEDQSGARAIVQHNLNVHSGESVHLDQNVDDQRDCQDRLHTAAALCEQIRHYVKEQTGFTSTMGVSVSKMLAKLSSDLNKPNSINVLYPWRSASVILPMPLRKIPDLGHASLKSLADCLKSHHLREPKFWTCRDLLQLPSNHIKTSLRTIKSTDEAADNLCQELLGKCRGLDNTLIEDDYGGLTKQVSVEDSFRRGTMKSSEAVWKALEGMFVRLPKLLDERLASSNQPALAYPTTIRLTTRFVDPGLAQQRRRPFRTQSKQCPFNGKIYLTISDDAKRRNMLKKTVEPLVRSLVFENPALKDINVTRINLAATNFQDLQSESAHSALDFAKSNACSFAMQSPLSAKRYRKSSELLSTQHDVIDPSVLSELPSDIAAEVKLMYPSPAKKEKTNRPIDSFFRRSSDSIKKI